MSVAESGNWQVITSDAEFAAIKDDWETLFESNPAHTPFQAWCWASAWLTHLAGPHDLFVICWRNESGGLEFIFPLIRATGNGRYRVPRLMSVCGYGPDCTDHLRCLRSPSIDSLQVEFVAEAIHRFCGGKQRIELASVDECDEYAMSLRRVLVARGRPVRLAKLAVCPTVALAGSWDSFLQQFSSNFRSQIRRHYNRIESHDALAFESIDTSAAGQFSQELIRLNRSRMGVKGKVSSLEDPDFRKFLLMVVPAMADAGLAWLDVVRDGDQVVGAALNFIHGNTVYYYMGGFDDSVKNVRPGTALFARVIMRGIEKGYGKYDFLRGKEPYKYRWGGTDEVSYQLNIFPRGGGGRLAYIVDGMRFGARKILRAVRSGIRKAT